jgi:hypothetical protein
MKYRLKIDFNDGNLHHKEDIFTKADEDTFTKADTEFYKNDRTENLIAFEIVENNPEIFEPIPEPIEIEGTIIGGHKLVLYVECKKVPAGIDTEYLYQFLNKSCKLTIL